MDQDELVELIERLSGDEHSWIDFKQDYEIGGIQTKKAEFVRDVASLANTNTGRDEHYIIVGVEDSGNLIGISEGRESYRGEGPKHIFSFDESSIQQIIDSNLTPPPRVAWHTYESDSAKFGVLIVEPLDSPPCLTSRNIDKDDDRLLHKGLIFIRKGSSKKIVQREEIEEIIEYRIDQQRKQILDGVHKAIEIGPEWIDRIANALPDESGVPLSTVSEPEEADLEVTQRLTRDPASSLDGELNEDISQWKYRGDDLIEPKPLWRYYASPNSLTLDKTALQFLTQSAIKNHVMGGFWLTQADQEDWSDIILGTPQDHLRAERAGSLVLLLGDEALFDDLMDNCRTNANYGHLKRCKRKFGNTIADRVNFLLKNDEYDLSHDGFNERIKVKDNNKSDIDELIPAIGQNLVDLQEKMEEYPRYGGDLEDFRNALWDLEVVYVGCIAGEYNT